MAAETVLDVLGTDPKKIYELAEELSLPVESVEQELKKLEKLCLVKRTFRGPRPVLHWVRNYV